jgi:hypothetical protein
LAAKVREAADAKPIDNREDLEMACTNAARAALKARYQDVANAPRLFAIEGTLAASQRLAKNEFEGHESVQEKRRAAEEYVERTRQLTKLELKPSVSEALIPVSEFYIADANLLLSKAKGASTAELRDSPPARNRLLAAKNAYQRLWNDVLQGAGSWEALYLRSLNWRGADIFIARTDAEVAKANENHLHRMQSLRRLFEDRLKGRSFAVVYATEFYCAEAEILVGKWSQDAFVVLGSWFH